MVGQCIVLAGGLGTRVRAITSGHPKALLEVGGKPFLDWQLGWLSSQGIRSVVLSIGYGAREIRHFVATGSAWGLTIQFVEEEGELLGTGGAVRKAAALEVIDEAVAVIYGDTLLQVTLRRVADAFERRKLSGLMTVLRNGNRWDRSNVAVSRGHVVRYTKASSTDSDLEYIDYGLTILKREAIFGGLGDGERLDLGVLYQYLCGREQLGAFEVDERFYEIGSPSGWRELDELLKSGWRPASTDDRANDR